jgi:hypothetical protein
VETLADSSSSPSSCCSQCGKPDATTRCDGGCKDFFSATETVRSGLEETQEECFTQEHLHPLSSTLQRDAVSFLTNISWKIVEACTNLLGCHKLHAWLPQVLSDHGRTAIVSVKSGEDVYRRNCR